MAANDSSVGVLFVCTGNTCRSPLAAAAFALELPGEAAKLRIDSAGTSAGEGQPASRGTRDIAEAHGIDLSRHRSKRVSAEMVRAADYVFVMEPLHRAAIEALGAGPGKVYVLSEWPEPGEPELPISDPFGASKEAYEECWRRIRLHVRRVAPAVRQALQARNAT